MELSNWVIGAACLWLTFSGCVLPTAAGDPDSDVAVTSQELVLAQGVVPPRLLVRSSGPDGVPVCFADNGFATERGWIRDAIIKAWQASSVVRFSGWGVCPANFASGFRATLFEGARIGHGTPHPVLAEIEVPVRWPGFCAESEAARQQCVRAIAIHEFGHALAFQHEFLRPHAPQNPCQIEAQTPLVTSGVYSDVFRSWFRVHVPITSTSFDVMFDL